MRCSLACLAVLLLAGSAHAQMTNPVAPVKAVMLADVLQFSLQRSPNVLLNQQQVEAARGSAMQALGSFDTVTEFSSSRTRNRIPLTPSEKSQLSAYGIDYITRHDSNQSNTRFAVQKTFQSGLVAGVDYSVLRNYDALAALQPGPIGQAQSTGRLTFSLQVPLLRNSGRDVAGAALEAAERELEASIATLEYASSQTILAVTQSYWDFVARQRLAELARESEQRAARMLDEMRKLAAADQIPKSDLELVLANNAEKTAYRVSAEQSLVSSRRALARQLGLSVVEELRLETAATPFPAGDARAGEILGRLDSLQLAAEQARADLRAAGLREQAAQLLRVAAQNNLKPLANLSLSLSDGGLALGAPASDLGSPYSTGRTGPTFTVGLQVQWPVENQQARGLLLSRSASAVGAEINRRDLQAAVGSGVQLAARALAAAAVQLDSAALAVKHYTQSAANEQTKRRLGAGTLIDVLNVEDRLTSAQQTEVQVRLAYATALAQVLFEGGRLLKKRGENEFEVPIDALLRYIPESAVKAER